MEENATREPRGAQHIGKRIHLAPKTAARPLIWRPRHQNTTTNPVYPVAGRSKRAQKEGLTNCRFQEGDACYNYGPTMNAYAAAETNGRGSDLHRELQELFESKKKSGSPDATSIPATFLRVTLTIR